jgi:hypothetical protein
LEFITMEDHTHAVTRLEEVNVGDVLSIRTLKGKDGGVIGRLLDGKVILFNRENTLFAELLPRQVVEARITYVAQTYIIVDPLSPPMTGVDGLKASLRLLADSADWEIAVIAESLLHIMNQLARHNGDGTPDV